MGVSGGGEHLATVTCDDGYLNNIKTGGLLYFTAGADLRINPEFSIQATINYHYDASTARNDDLKFERFPLELIGYYHSSEQ